MPKLTKADVARHLGISRQTLYEWIQQGRISVGPDGFIDSSEVVRMSGSVTRTDVRSERHHGQQVTSPQGDTTRELIEVLKAQLEEARANERFLREQVDRLTSIIDRRLLEAPRPSAPAGVPPPLPPVATRHAPPPETWQRIVAYMQQHPGPQRPQDVQQGLGWTHTARHIFRHMTDAGVLHRLQQGTYILAATEGEETPT